MRRRLSAAADVFEPRGNFLSIGRSVLAFAQLTILLATPDRILFFDAAHPQFSSGCTGVAGLSLWCVTGVGPHAAPVGRIVAIPVLAAVVAGYRPRWLCVPHFYVSFSLAAMSVVDGGDQVAQIVTGLLIPICLGDGRTWQWERPTDPLPPTWRGSAYAGHLFLRLQIMVVYLDAALSKLRYPAWRRGTALGTLFNDPEFGLPSALQSAAHSVLGQGWGIALLTWCVLAIELTIAASMLLGGRGRRVGLVLAIALHSAIIVGLGLFSFGFIMIATLVLACAASSPPPHPAADAPPGRHLRDLTSAAVAAD